MKYVSINKHTKKCSAVHGVVIICNTHAIIHIFGGCSWFSKCRVCSTDYRLHVGGKILLYMLDV